MSSISRTKGHIRKVTKGHFRKIKTKAGGRKVVRVKQSIRKTK